MNRVERRRCARQHRRWLAAIAADPAITREEMLVALAVAENASSGRIWLPSMLTDEGRRPCCRRAS